MRGRRVRCSRMQRAPAGYHRAMRHALRVLFVGWALLAPPACTSERGETRAPAPVPVLDLNSATEKDMEALPGIGPERARSIMASRNARGGRFRRLEDLLDIKGIGPETVEKIRPYVVLGPGR